MKKTIKIQAKQLIIIALTMLIFNCAGNIKKQEIDINEIKRVLNVNELSEVNYNYYPYYVSEYDVPALLILAGIKAKTVKCSDNGICEGNYSRLSNPIALKEVMNEVDVNKDFILTSFELDSLMKVMR